MTNDIAIRYCDEYLARHISDIDKEFLKIAKEALQQEPKTGRWIRVEKDKLRCSECEVVHLIAQYPNGKINWCPNCGAKMVEPQESEG